MTADEKVSTLNGCAGADRRERFWKVGEEGERRKLLDGGGGGWGPTWAQL